MSLYREAGRARRNRRIAIGAAIAAALVVGLIVLLATSGGAPSHADHVRSARSAASEALDGIEVLTVEYGQGVRNGRVVAATEYAGSKADVQRARSSLTGHEADFEAVDRAAYRRALTALDALAATVDRRADIAPAVRSARAALQPFAA